MRLKGKVALISGAARGMGAAEARLFAKEGAHVVLGDVLHQQGQAVADEINDAGGQALFVPLDVTSEDSWRDVVDAAVERFGKLNVLVNNAGILVREELEEGTDHGWDSTMNVNAKGVFLGMKLAVPAMRNAGGGSIINISSISGIVSLGYPAYNASKGAVRLLTKNVAIQYSQQNIRVNSIHPGVINTDMMAGDTRSDEDWDRLIPLGRFAEPIEVAYGALFLASDESSFMTGSELVIDGGFTAQ